MNGCRKLLFRTNTILIETRVIDFRSTGIKFMIRRQCELLMLTLGESVLAMANGTWWSASAEDTYQRFYGFLLMRFCGLLLVVGMLYMVVFAQPDAAHEHSFSRGAGFKILYQASFFAICTLMPLLATTLRLALQNPHGFKCPILTKALNFRGYSAP